MLITGYYKILKNGLNSLNSVADKAIWCLGNEMQGSFLPESHILEASRSYKYWFWRVDSYFYMQPPHSQTILPAVARCKCFLWGQDCIQDASFSQQAIGSRAEQIFYGIEMIDSQMFSILIKAVGDKTDRRLHPTNLWDLLSANAASQGRCARRSIRRYKTVPEWLLTAKCIQIWNVTLSASLHSSMLLHIIAHASIFITSYTFPLSLSTELSTSYLFWISSLHLNSPFHAFGIEDSRMIYSKWG